MQNDKENGKRAEWAEDWRSWSSSKLRAYIIWRLQR